VTVTLIKLEHKKAFISHSPDNNMLIWAIIAISLGFLIFTFLKTQHKFDFIKTISIVFFAFILVSSVFVVYNSDTTDLNTPKGIITVSYGYLKWLGGFTLSLWDIGFESTGKVITTLNNSKIEYNN
jgi:exosortase/archaeosortase